MAHPLLDIDTIDEAPEEYLHKIGSVFARFDHTTQDSGNLSYGVEAGDRRFFVKTAGLPGTGKAFMAHPERVALLRNAVRLNAEVEHAGVPPLYRIVESPAGPMLVYRWVEGELVRAAAERRGDPQSAYQRFGALPVEERARAFDTVYEVHALLATRGWVAVDLYDGSLIYDFGQKRLYLVDLDHYHKGVFTNAMGRMFGSTRFMAPEEFELGATIDQRTTVFTLGRLAAVFMGDGTLDAGTFAGGPALHAVVARACRPEPRERYTAVADFYTAWQAARQEG